MNADEPIWMFLPSGSVAELSRISIKLNYK